ncbi:MAG: 30S ribosomal protein S16 [Patescibacteria group bacterium]|nr:30S ribosomal protein S16 [Patescibacteria group bacterium]
MLHIRLTRIGKKKQPEYRLIVCEKARDPWGKALEILGHYNPRTNPVTVTLKSDRITHWISNGAQCSDTVWNLLVDQGVVKGEKRKSIKLSKKRHEAIAKKQKASDKAKEEAKEAAKVETVPAPKEETPAETPVPEDAKSEEKPVEEASAEEPKAE